jgi:hypothetical protein
MDCVHNTHIILGYVMGNPDGFIRGNASSQPAGGQFEIVKYE